MPASPGPRRERAPRWRPSSEPASTMRGRGSVRATSRQPGAKKARPGHTVDEARPFRHAVMRAEWSLSGYSCHVSCHAFVLGGGGLLGAAEAGMASALLDAGIRPDVVCGTSVGAINGAALAADPTPDGAKRLVAFWDRLMDEGALDGSMLRRGAGVGRRRASFPGHGGVSRMLPAPRPL